ncbi:coiled-coil domain-containing protein 96 isoform X2 [Takifugu flavidus]|uniref:coiled-coil domain-containing protein 96 isoform X2 n=1 Tax=Takifugu flavidus TaxID=433684 RepID=UPI002544C18A|nr:coiled-coil domain-containing protein 96 isoform X2 [Takifugu flavidus]
MSGQSVQRSRSRWRTTSVPTVVRRGRSIMTDSIPQPEDVSPENLNEDVPRAAEEVPPEEAPEDTTEEAAEDTPEEAAEDTPEEAAEDTPEEAPEDTPEEAAEDTPEEAPEEVPEEAAEDTPKEAAEDTPEEAAEDTPEEAAEDTPEEAPEDTPEDTPEEAPEEAPEEGGQDQSVDEGEQHLCGEDSFDPGFQYEGEGSLLLDGPENQDDTSHEETEESSAFPGDEGALNEQEYEELLEQLLEQRDEALNHSSQLQAKLPQYIKRNSRNFGGLDSDVSSAEQLQMYQQNMKMLRDLKEQLVLEAQQAQEQIKELASRCQEKKNEVDREWRAFLAQKKKAAVPELSRRLGFQAARAKVDSILEAEQQHQEELVKQRLKNIRLNIKIRRLEAALRDWEEDRDPVQVQFEQLQAKRLEQKRQAEKDKERSVKMQQKICSSLELLSNMKEKIFLSETHVQLRREELAELEAEVARRRDLLLRTQQACSNLHQDNARLKEEWGLLGHKTLLQDLETTLDATNSMEQHLKALKEQHKAQRKKRCDPGGTRWSSGQ